MVINSDPVGFLMEAYLSTALEECYKGKNGQTVDELTHRVFFTSRDNQHQTPNVPSNNNMLNDNKFVYELPNKNKRTAAQLAATHQGYWDEFVRTSATDAQIKHSFSYEFNNPMIEKLQLDAFYDKNPAVKNDKGGYEYEEWMAYLMHTIWLTESNTLSRWFEWYLTIRTYTTLKPTNTKKASVYPVEIKVPVCDDCIMTVTHSGQIKFHEERDVNAAGFPNTNPMVYRAEGCDWDTERTGLAFESLAKGVCFGITLKQKTSKRSFVLQRLTYGYNGNRVSSKVLYDKFKNIKSSQLEDFKWDNTRKQLQVKLKFLTLGAVQELVYQAAIKLCAIGDTFNANVCNEVKVADCVAGQDCGKDMAPIKAARLRMLEGHEPSRRRWLADKDKAVVQQYTTEESYVGGYAKPVSVNGETTETTNNGLVAVMGGIIILGAIGGIVYCIW